MECFTIIILINFLKKILNIIKLYKMALMDAVDILHLQKELIGSEE